MSDIDQDKESVLMQDNIVTAACKKIFKDFKTNRSYYIKLFIISAIAIHLAMAFLLQNFAGFVNGGEIVIADLFVPFLITNPGLVLVEACLWFFTVLIIVQMKGVFDRPYEYDERLGIKVVRDQTGRPEEGASGIGGNADFMSEEDEKNNFLRSKTLEDFPYQILGIDENGYFCAKIPGNKYTNDNASIFGCPGCGKSACIVLPSIYQAIRGGRSFVVTDSKGSVYRESAYFAQKAGMVTKVLNFKPKEMHASDGINFMKGVHTRLDATTMTTIIMKNTNDGKKEDFWYDAGYNLLLALISYVAFDKSIMPEERNLVKVYDMLIENTPDSLAELLGSLKPDHAAYASGVTFASANESVRQSTHSGLAIRLNLLSQPVVREFLSHDEIDFRLPVSQPCAYYVIISDIDSSAKFLACLFFSMMFTELFNEVDGRYKGKSPLAVDFILDEFKATGSIKDFGNILSTSRSRKINVQFIMQDLQQLETMYPDEWHTLINDCTTNVFIKAREPETLNYFSGLYGNRTILVSSKSYGEDVRTIFKTHADYRKSESFQSRALLTPDDLAHKITNDELVVNLEAKHTAILRKFNYWEHPFYKILVDEKHGGARPKYLSAKDHIPKWRQTMIDETGVDPYAEDAEAAPVDDLNEELEKAKEQHSKEQQEEQFVRNEKPKVDPRAERQAKKKQLFEEINK